MVAQIFFFCNYVLNIPETGKIRRGKHIVQRREYNGYERV